MNNQHKVYIFGLCFLLAVFIPYTLFFGAEIPAESSQSEGESTLLEEEDDRMFPEDYMLNLTNFYFEDGKGSVVSGSIEDLTLPDDNTLEIKGDYRPLSDKYEFEVVFEFDVDIDTYGIDYYDLFIFFETEVSIYSETVDLEVYTFVIDEYQWQTIGSIGNQPLVLYRQYIERTTKFRIIGSTDADKKIEIDHFQYLLTHNNDLLTVFNNVQHNYCYNGGTWWTARNDYNEWTQGTGYFSSGYRTINKTITFRLNYQPDGEIYNITNVDELRMDVSIWGDALNKYGDFYIWNAKNNTWDLNHHTLGGWGSQTNWYTEMNSLSINPRDYVYKDIDGYWKWRFNVFAYGEAAGSSVQLWISFDYCRFIFDCIGFGLDDHDYPEFEEMRTNPQSPITTYIETFQVRARVLPHNPLGSIDNVKCYIYNSNLSSFWFSDLKRVWFDMVYDTNYWWYYIFDASEFPSDSYTVWLNATDDDGFATIDSFEFIVQNIQPIINFIKPGEELEKVIQLYDYNVNVSVYDPEGEEYWIYGDPEIIIYQDNELDPWLNWTDMERYNPLNPNYWNYTFDPINLTNGIYTIKIRASDIIGYGYNSTQILIQNNPPNIEIISPSITEIITPLNQVIRVNISNEEPINTAEWTITPTIGDYNWNNLTYNISSTFWEDTFSLLDYKYGDYYLIINSTDDKYNSSIESKEIQLHPLITYYIPYETITYNNIEIRISNYEDQTDDISATFTLAHHSVAQERDFEIYIPDQLDDAHEYYLTRGYETHYPAGFNVEGVYTIWHLLDYETSDLIHFKLEKPKLYNNPFEEDNGDYEMIFTLSSKHTLSDLTIENVLTEYISNPENYEYALYYNYGGEYREIQDLEIESGGGGYILFSFSWDKIIGNSTIEFRFTAIQLEVEETDWTPIIVGATLGAFGVGISVFIIFGFKKHEDWGKAKAILLSIGIGAAAGIIGYLIVVFI